QCNNALMSAQSSHTIILVISRVLLRDFGAREKGYSYHLAERSGLGAKFERTSTD
ncbi:hypothetical protein BaRGS_00040426, partial [Batillaria attramentaria]